MHVTRICLEKRQQQQQPQPQPKWHRVMPGNMTRVCAGRMIRILEIAATFPRPFHRLQQPQQQHE